MELAPDLLQAIRLLREEIREAEGGGGMCHFVSEVLHRRHGWTQKSGVYTNRAGEVICSAHLWNELPDGTLLDATADQFGEGHDVRVIRPGDPEHLRYRLEWFEDFNPEVEPVECPARLGYSTWIGEFDHQQDSRLRKERGSGWWVTDLACHERYLAQQEQYRALRSERLLAARRIF